MYPTFSDAHPKWKLEDLDLVVWKKIADLMSKELLVAEGTKGQVPR